MAETALIAARQDGALARIRTAWAALRPYAALEARRNRLLYRASPVLVIGTLPLSAAIGAAAGFPLAQGVAAGLLAWGMAGLPVSAVIFGASVGADLRGAAAEAEASLPVSPRQRAFAALSANAAGLAAVAAVVCAATAALRPDSSHFLSALSDLGANVFGDSRGVEVPAAAAAAVAALGLFWLEAAAFTAAFVSGHAVLAGVLALLGGAVVLTPLAAGLLLHFNFGALAGYSAPAVFWAAAGLAGALAAAARVVPAAARGARLGWKGALLAAALPFCGALGAWPALFAARDRVIAAAAHGVRPWDAKNRVQSGAVRGALQLRRGGRLELIDGERSVLLFKGDRPSLPQLLLNGPLRQTYAFRDAAGQVWAETYAPGSHTPYGGATILRGDGTGLLKHYMVLPRKYAFISTEQGHAAIQHLAPILVHPNPNPIIVLDPDRPPDPRLLPP